MKYEPVIGLEVHTQLLTKTKIFCRCRSAYGLDPNSVTCPVCLGLPGALPMLNESAVEMAIRMILAAGGRVRERSVFARKNYFYPDLPKGYQISQFDKPVGDGGWITFDEGAERKQIRLNRIHLEEDAGKSLHPESDVENYSRIDMNRCGVPLLEIVSEPDIRSAREAYLYLHRLKQIVEYLEICDGNMEKGSLRCDANVSVRPLGEAKLGTKTEVKNMNSIRGIERALTYEINRQVALLESGRPVEQQTLLYNEADGKCYPMRSKEESHDYRYFPEPDLVNLVVSRGWIEEIRKTLPEFPTEKIDRFVREYHIPPYDAEVLASSRGLADYYEETVKVCSDSKLVSNWIMTDVLRVLNDQMIGIDRFCINPARLGILMAKIKSQEITGKIGKELFELMLSDNRPVDVLIEEKGFAPLTDSAELEQLVDQILAKNPGEVDKFRKGKTKVLGFLVGQLMKTTNGKADPETANRLFKMKLGS